MVNTVFWIVTQCSGVVGYSIITLCYNLEDRDLNAETCPEDIRTTISYLITYHITSVTALF